MVAEAEFGNERQAVNMGIETPLRWEWSLAAFLTVLWGAALFTYGMGYFGIFEEAGARRSATMLEIIIYGAALVVPILLIWFAAWFLRQSAALKSDVEGLSAQVDRLAGALETQDPANRDAVITAVRDVAEETLRAEQARIGTHFRTLGDQQQQLVDAIRALMKKSGADQQTLQSIVETAADVAERASRKTSAPAKPRGKGGKAAMIEDMDARQEMLPFADGGEANAPDGPVEWDHLIRALNFPHDASDEAGFAAIRRYLSHRLISQVLQAAEDVLSMLAQEGIYMDDLSANEANPDLWRAFAGGSRGSELEEMAAIEDQAAFTLTRGRMRNDQIFKDASLHFVRLFDRLLDSYIDDATDRDIRLLAQTRTGLAFTMLATINGAFD